MRIVIRSAHRTAHESLATKYCSLPRAFSRNSRPRTNAGRGRRIRVWTLFRDLVFTSIAPPSSKQHAAEGSSRSVLSVQDRRLTDRHGWVSQRAGAWRLDHKRASSTSHPIHTRHRHCTAHVRNSLRTPRNIGFPSCRRWSCRDRRRGGPWRTPLLRVRNPHPSRLSPGENTETWRRRHVLRRLMATKHL